MNEPGFWRIEWGIIDTKRHQLIGVCASRERADYSASKIDGGVVKQRRVWTSEWVEVDEKETGNG